MPDRLPTGLTEGRAREGTIRMKPLTESARVFPVSTVSHYRSTVRAAAPLSREEEADLVERYQRTGDAEARRALLTAQLGAVVAIALRYRHYGLPVDELASEGNLGLVHALSKFDRTHGTRFMTYARFWVRAQIVNYVIRSSSVVGAGPLRSKLFFRLRRERAKMLALVGDGERAERMLAEALGLSVEKAKNLLTRLEARDLSLDTPVHDEASTTYGDMLASTDPPQDEALEHAETSGRLRDGMAKALQALDPRERFIVEERLMAYGEDERSLAELGRELGVSRERARQLESRAKRKLRKRLCELRVLRTDSVREMFSPC
jgi:RNA polymerase sigma-32 factor